MFYSIASVYLLLKLVYFYGLVKAQVSNDGLKDHWLFLGFLYTTGVAILSYVFLVSWQKIEWAAWQVRFAGAIGISPWLAWVGQTLVLSSLYFRLLARFDEGVLFWTLLLSGLLLVWF